MRRILIGSQPTACQAAMALALALALGHPVGHPVGHPGRVRFVALRN